MVLYWNKWIHEAVSTDDTKRVADTSKEKGVVAATSEFKNENVLSRPESKKCGADRKPHFFRT